MNTVEALKALYEALGGSADTVANMVIIPDVIAAIATLVSEGIPGTLPEVKDTDEGKVLNSTYFGKTVAQFGVNLKKELNRNVANEHNFLQLCKYLICNKHLENREDLVIDLFDKIALPLTTIVLVLIGIPLAITPPRVRYNRGFLFSILIIFAYYLIRALSLSFGQAGTLHPFQIPLDSLGSNIVLADPNNRYDVYFYNKYGSLIMSRYNVKCQGSGSGGASQYIGDRLEYGQYTASNVLDVATLNRTQGNIATTLDGKIKLKEDMSYHITVRGSYVIADPLIRFEAARSSIRALPRSCRRFCGRSSPRLACAWCP